MQLMEMHPGCVFSKPRFTALPQYLSGGTDFVLILSSDEPFSLVAIEFGCKGTPGAGPQLDGFGLMPGWVSNTRQIYPVGSGCGSAATPAKMLMNIFVTPCPFCTSIFASAVTGRTSAQAEVLSRGKPGMARLPGMMSLGRTMSNVSLKGALVSFPVMGSAPSE